jgi:hypothetical protein
LKVNYVTTRSSEIKLSFRRIRPSTKPGARQGRCAQARVVMTMIERTRSDMSASDSVASV